MVPDGVIRGTRRISPYLIKRQERFLTKACMHIFHLVEQNYPHWLNRESVPNRDFDLQQTFEKILRKPIFVERSIEKLVQWLLSVLID